jgi:TatD DNase family protein
MLERARDAGVRALLAICAGTSPTERLDAAIPFAEQYDWIYATVGIHPHDANVATEEQFARLDELARHPRVIAWGEMGLDYHYDHSPRDVQQQVFRRQLGQAHAAKLPIVIHCRDAWDDCLAILEWDWKPMGFLISFAGNVTYPKMQPLREVAREIPLERVLTETDSPFLPPQGRRGKRNEPAFVVEVAQALANVRNLPAHEVAAAAAANFRRLFQLGTENSGQPI